MKSKSFFFITIAASLCIIIASYSYWKLTLEKTNKEVVAEVNTDKTEKKKKKVDGKEVSNSTKKESPFNHEITVAMKNDAITNKVEERLNAEEPIRYLIIGSDYMTTENNIFPEVFTNVMENELMGNVEVEYYLFTEDASISTIANSDEINNLNKEAYDIVILDPFTYNNHGLLSYEDTAYYLNEVLDFWEDSEAVVIVHPNPKATSLEYGPERYDHIEGTMNNRSEIWIDVWNDIEEGSLDTYITAEGFPTDEGLDFWANQLSSYFIESEGSNN
ncbi:hypothetical protein [Pseudogracilibacillus sp. ICA-222130]|uniref:hypothetical protein n=1 Tax=Pseudogracilibacillus sp. ICA-222130 TaxID=3134655 RepID=UPI0030C3F476